MSDILLKTERLTVRPASDAEMLALVEAETDAEMRKAYSEMCSLALERPEERLWYVAWFVERSGVTIGNLCFKGLSPDGRVEIGYGLLPGYFGHGYATEAVGAAVSWAKAQSGVTAVEAETEPGNKASQRVLEKLGFVPTGEYGEEGPRFILK